LPCGPCWLILRGLFGTQHGHPGRRPEIDMKADIHPKYTEIKVLCSCGNQFTTRSTLGRELHVEVCSACHPFYTGQQKILDTGGRVDQFKKRYRRGS
jgi:large subunit ribosomal protein L31